MQRIQGVTGPEGLAELRRRGDALRARLDKVRERLARCVALARRLPEIERAAADARGGAYRRDGRNADDELAEARGARAERSRLRIEEAELMAELEGVRASLAWRGIRHVALPLLEDVQVASPCTESWADMQGDADTRFCTKCEKHVHNLSMMSREEAEAVIAASAGKDLCVRLYRRADGTVLTQDCPVGVRRHRFWRRTTGVAAAGLLLAALGAIAYANLGRATHVTAGAVVSGGLGSAPPQ